MRSKTISKTITQIGIVVSGFATLEMWGGGQGTIEMEECFLPNGKITPKNILRCVNDNGFGCQKIVDAEINILILYDNGSKEYDRTISGFNKKQVEYFSGWRELQEQGIKV